MLWLIWLMLGVGLWAGAFALDRPGNWTYWPVWLKLLPIVLMPAVPVFLVLPYFASGSFLRGTLALIAGIIGTFALVAARNFGLKGNNNDR